MVVPPPMSSVQAKIQISAMNSMNFIAKRDRCGSCRRQEQKGRDKGRERSGEKGERKCPSCKQPTVILNEVKNLRRRTSYHHRQHGFFAALMMNTSSRWSSISTSTISVGAETDAHRASFFQWQSQIKENWNS